MSRDLPIFGTSRVQRSEPLSMQTIDRLREGLLERAPDGQVTHAVVSEVALEHSAPRAHAYVALGTDPRMALETEWSVQLFVCTGGCLQQGALGVVDALVRLRDEREASGADGFDIVPRTCLSMCPHAPAVISRSPHGMALHPRPDASELPEVVSQLCGR